MGLKERVRGAAIGAYLGSGAARRGWEGMKRALRRGRRPVTFYHRVDDPYSYLLAQALPLLLDAFPVDLEVVVVPAPAADADPEPQLREGYALRDAALLARYLDLDFPADAEVPGDTRVRRANAILLSPRPAREQLEAARVVGDALFRGDAEALSKATERFGSIPGQRVRPELEEQYARLRSAGHYMGGMLHYGGEWYWGVDRLAYLEERLVDEGLPEPPRPAVARRPPESRPAPEPLPERDGKVVLTLFFSFRSPYSYIVLPRVRELMESLPIHLDIRPVLPMVMRGLPVPRDKRMYIVKDAKREADRLGVPFGKICDPVGEGVERCLAIWPHAEAEGKGLAFLEAAGRGIWSEARDVASDEGLAAVVEAAGLDWTAAQAFLADDRWRALAEANRTALLELGLWGVPSFALGELTAWGQDRLWILEDRIRQHLTRRGD